MKIICFLSCLLFLGINIASAQDGLQVEARYAIDSNSTWGVLHLQDKSFTRFPQKQKLDIGYNVNTSVWCSFKVKNLDSKRYSSHWLSFDNIHIDSLVFFDKLVAVKTLGDRTSSLSPFLDAPAFQISLNPGEERSFYVLVKKGISFLEFSYRFSDGSKLAKRSDAKIAIISFFLGIIFLLILFNVILFYISRKRLFLYYSIYSILSATYIAISTNYAKRLLFSDFLYFSEFRIYVSSLWFIALSAFLANFIDLKKYEPRKYKIIWYVNLANIVIIFITIAFLLEGKLSLLKPFMLIGYANFLTIIALISWCTILHLKINREAAIYIIFAFLPQVVWVAGIILKSFALIPRDIHTDWLVIIFLYEVLLFGYVLTKNYMETFQSNNALIKEIINEKEKSLQAITQVQIRERRTIANIIHDNFGSKIAYILQLLHLKNYLLADANIKEMANEIREISHQILPKSLDDGALAPSIESQINSLNMGLRDSKIELYSYDFPEKLDEIWIYDMYLVTLEIINNSLKHGRAKSISIELYDYPSQYLFQFTDDGIGFDTHQVAKGFGLDNIEKRVNNYHGEFEVNSSLSNGTVIQISIPKK